MAISTEKRGYCHGKAFFFPWQSFRRNSDDPLVAWQQRREYVAIATALPRMKKSQPVAISTERRRKVPRKVVYIATARLGKVPRQAVDIATARRHKVPWTAVDIATVRRRKVPRLAVDIATVGVVFEKKIWYNKQFHFHCLYFSV